MKPQSIKLVFGFIGAYNLIEEVKLVCKRELNKDRNISNPMLDGEQVNHSDQRCFCLCRKKKKEAIQCPLDVQTCTGQHDIEACNQTITDFHVYY